MLICAITFEALGSSCWYFSSWLQWASLGSSRIFGIHSIYELTHMQIIYAEI